jgi:cbb3-type cytochrome oxidase maturation protein
MTVLVILIPVSLLLGGIGLVAFLWMLRHNQYEDPEGAAMRVLSDRYDDAPAEDGDTRHAPDSGMPES